jgi:hypothetical protein
LRTTALEDGKMSSWGNNWHVRISKYLRLIESKFWSLRATATKVLTSFTGLLKQSL